MVVWVVVVERELIVKRGREYGFEKGECKYLIERNKLQMCKIVVRLTKNQKYLLTAKLLINK